MNNGSSRLLLPMALLGCCLFAVYIAIFRPDYLSSASYLGGLIFLQVVLAALWDYRQRFLPLLLVVFLWAGMDVPLETVWTSGRWFVLAVGAVAGFILYAKGRHQHFGTFHLVAFVCVLAALISAMVSPYPSLAVLKALSLLLLFLYGAAGARLAIVGRAAKFFSGLLLGCEILVYSATIAYFVLGLRPFGNPNSLGAVMGVVVAPLMVWGVLVSEDKTIRRRRILAFALSLLLLFFSFARAGIVAGAVSCVLLCVALRRYRLLIKGMSVALLSAALIAAVVPPQSGQPDSVASVFLYKGHREAGLLGSRQSSWQKTVSVIRDHPWFGSGFGTSPTSVEENVQTGKYASLSKAAREHGNSYLAIAEWVGLLGVSPFFTVVLLIAVNIGRVAAWTRRTGDPFSPAVPIAVILTGGLVHAAFEDWLFAAGYYLCLFFWAFAFVLVDVLPAPAPAKASVPRASRPWAGSFGIVTPGR